MSVEKLSWALAAEVHPATCKLVLIALANSCPADGLAFPSVKTICRQTSLNRKTVLGCVKKLQEGGFISDTGIRVGATKSIRAFDLNSPKNGTAIGPKNGIAKRSRFYPLSGPENGIQNNKVTRSMEHEEEQTRKPRRRLAPQSHPLRGYDF